MVVSEVLSTEISFPRGGRIRKTNEEKNNVERKVPKEKDLFSSSLSSNDPNAKKKQKKKKLAKQKAIKENADIKPAEVVDALSYGQLAEGMLLMGRIAAIRELDMRISLPGRLMASCPITNISSSYTTALKDITQGKLMETDSDEYPRYLCASLICMPGEINYLD